jgi:hypothetical protein
MYTHINVSGVVQRFLMCYESTEGRADKAILNAHRRNTKSPEVYTSYSVSSQSAGSEMKPLT